MLTEFVELAEHFEKGQLYADNGALIKFGEWGDHKAEAQRRLDKNLSKARELLKKK
jgi:hypothetical protein